MSNRSQTQLPRAGVRTTQGNGHPQSSRQCADSSKRRRRNPDELVWTQPRTIPASLHMNARRLSRSPTVLSTKESAVQAHPGQHKRQDASLSTSLTPSSQSTLGREVPEWTMDTDFLRDLGGAHSVPVVDDVVVQDFLPCPTTRPDTTSSAIPQSKNRQTYSPHIMDGSYLCSRDTGPADESTEDSDNSVPIAPDFGLNLTGFVGFSAIHLAAHLGKFSIIRLLLSACPENVDLLNNDAQTPLHIAAAEGHAEVIPELLRSGANTLLQDVNGHTALHVAVSKEHFNIVRLLLDDTHSQAMIRMADSTGRTPLHQAVLQECDQVVHLLLERGADPRTPLG